MSRRWNLLFVVGALLLVGCGTLRRDRASDASSDAASSSSSDRTTERRAEAHAHYAMAAVYDWNEDWDDAAREYYAAASANPGDEMLVLESSQRLVQLKQPDKALEILRKGADAGHANGPIYAQIGRIQTLQGDKEAAKESFRGAIKRDPKSIIGYRYLVQLHLQNREHDEAGKLLDQAARHSRPDAPFLIELGDLYVAFLRAKPDDAVKAKALDIFQRAAKLNPTNALWLQMLADGFAAVGENDRAMDLYLKLVNKRPAIPGVREKLTELYLRKKDRKKAVEQLQALIRDNPVSPQAYYLLGSLAFESKEYKEAIESFRKTILLNPTFEPVYFDLAAAQLNLKQPRDALTTLEKARAKFRETFPLEFYTAMAYGALKDYGNAVKHLTAAEVMARATETNRLTHQFYFQLGSAYERIQKYDEAEKYFQKCLEQAPDYPEALNYLGYMWAERGTNLAQAKDLIQRALKLEPKNAAYLDSMAWVLYKLDQTQEALSWQLQAIEKNPEPDPALYDHLGDIYAALHQRDKARESWQKAVALEPNQAIQKKLESDSAAGKGSAP